jgi:hypothetical protein
MLTRFGCLEAKHLVCELHLADIEITASLKLCLGLIDWMKQ